MLDIIFFVKGLVIGVLASIPLGPIGVLCIQRTLNKRFLSGLVSGLGATTADTLFAMAAIFFLSIVTSFIEKQMELLTIVGGAIIMIIGYTIFTKKMSANNLRKNRSQNSRYVTDYISTFLLTLANPAFIFVLIGLFTSFNISNEDLNFANGVFTILGVTSGSTLWWFTLTYSVDKFRRKFRPRHLILINKIAGIAIFTLGFIAIITPFIIRNS